MGPEIQGALKPISELIPETRELKGRNQDLTLGTFIVYRAQDQGSLIWNVETDILFDARTQDLSSKV